MPTPSRPAAVVLGLVGLVGLGSATAMAEPAAMGAAADFTADAKLLFRVAACGNADPLPAGMDAKVVDKHCAVIGKRMAAFRKRYFEDGRAFFDQLVPDDAPGVVVYPFGGGDLISALVAFPDASEITTISLELAGDPRRLPSLDRERLKTSLAALRAEIGGLLDVGSNTSENLSSSQRSELPAQVSSALLALAAGGYEPVAMRYFRLGPGGEVLYLRSDELPAAVTPTKQTRAKSRKGDWRSPNFAEEFAHVELAFRKVGSDRIQIHRHLGWNLGDGYLRTHGELLAHLATKGRVTWLTKGASYLLWRKDFAVIRDFMLGHLAWMLSDSTGIPPAFASAKGMVQDTYGRYTGAFLPHAEAATRRHSDDFRALWRKNPKRPLTLRFGYLDAGMHPHLVVTRPAR